MGVHKPKEAEDKEGERWREEQKRMETEKRRKKRGSVALWRERVRVNIETGEAFRGTIYYRYRLTVCATTPLPAPACQHFPAL